MDLVTLLEIGTVLYLLVTILYSSYNNRWLVLPYLVIYFAGFSYISFLNISDYLNDLLNTIKIKMLKKTA